MDGTTYGQPCFSELQQCADSRFEAALSNYAQACREWRKAQTEHTQALAVSAENGVRAKPDINAGVMMQMAAATATVLAAVEACDEAFIAVDLAWWRLVALTGQHAIKRPTRSTI